MSRKYRLQTRLWIYFAVFAVFIIGVLWLLQVFSFKPMYYSMEKNKIVSLGDSVTYEWRNVHYSRAASIQFYQDEVSVRIFNMAGISQNTDVLQSDPDTLDAATYIRKFERSGEEIYTEIVSTSSTSSYSDYLVYISKIENPDYPEHSLYVYIVHSLGALESVSAIQQEQLFILSLVIIALSLLISWMISSRIARPIVAITKQAGRLAAGDYEVRFQNDEFREIHQLSEALNHATFELARTDQLKSEVLANVSHDLRTPLTMIKAYAEMIRDLSGENPKKREEHIGVIIQEADWMSELITDILEYSRLQSGNMYYEMTRFDLSELTKECIRRFRNTTGRKRNIRIYWDGTDDRYIWGDRKRIERVLHNLISNALKHSPENGWICVSVWRFDHIIHWQVRDYGSGIPPEDLEKIWDQYFTRGRGADRGSEGTGLGLSIVKGILEDHGAKYGVSSEIGEGTRFWFEMQEKE